MENLIDYEHAKLKASVKVSAFGKSTEVELDEERISSGDVFNEVMEGIGFKYVEGGDCRNCDAKFICKRVENLTNSFCLRYAGSIGSSTWGSYLGRH